MSPTPLPPEPGLTPDELVARAEALVPALVERQAETEKRTYYAEDTHKLFTDSGFYRILVPRRYGGYEFGLDTFMRVAMTLARGCPSTGWMFCLGAGHALIAATIFDESAQHELFRDGNFICPLVIGPGGTAERTAEGEWLLNGTWSYGSGAPYATHFAGIAIASGAQGNAPHPVLFVAPRDRWTRLDDWGNLLGLRGSGSHSVTFDNATIPDHFVIESDLNSIDVTSGTPGLALHGNPQYSAAPLSAMCIEGASLAVGMAQGALDAYADLMRTKTTLGPIVVPRLEDPDFQRWYGQAAGQIAAAEAATLGAIRKWDEACAQGPFTPDKDLRIALVCREAAELAWRAVDDIIFPTAGTSSAVRAGERIERVWRDMSTGHSHVGFAVVLTTVVARGLAQIELAA
ncbi:3-hydroxy-9,10-secoandrosta-1,3,5(10)-triene-9,17-dione monooxygenase [Amycolatopsis arida]|uniref:3-hydroxy-9,10-secoandrosta-1,3,5(10)-triene-9,17-dione monooxygenase n=2 Tax=Amycolatopsis arida TaxID=587909 RepID=A0A1I5QAZ1_9PSEU|nr:3-hydroxy-9,10-secoandrosta-1,3,5(10)-triene-9,17-dione monooxygenase [Amycolatopsis arida]SFP43425.1 3-hydroxy-9,10-secoandrosta-1,3,5(10)-triene-9,17-dione monooxygenase [Amycolatopsis arida]